MGASTRPLARHARSGSDPRRAAGGEEIQRRSLNPAGDGALQYLLRPQNTEECRIAVEVLGSVGCHPQPIGSLTTFWEPHPLDTEVGLDTLGLRTPVRIDIHERIGYFGAGTTVREVDRLARTQGLCLVAYPDSDGTASVGSMAAVACTSGLGLGRIQPVEQIVGLTIVTREATILKTGAAWRLGRGGVAYGMPDPSRDVSRLARSVRRDHGGGADAGARAVSRRTPLVGAVALSSTLADALRRARQEMDRGMIDSLGSRPHVPGGARPTAIEWFVRCWAPESAESADQRCAAVAQALGARDAGCWVESAAGRRGELPDHDARYSLPPGTHHERTGREGFLGMEVNVNWGDQLDTALAFSRTSSRHSAPSELGHRRLGIYPGPHTVAIGVQTMLSGGEATPDMVRGAMAKFVEPLSTLGAVPYRQGRLWREIGDPACALIRRAALASRPS